MGRFILILILIAFLSMTGCSSRIIYEQRTSSTATAQSTININTASVDELEKLPYIGPKTAEKIIQFREENGPFRRVEHLMQIRGISEKRFLEIKPFLKAE